MKWWKLLLILAAQVVIYGLIEGNRPANAGNALLYFMNWFHEAMLHGAPMVLVTLGMGLTARAGGVDLSIASTGAISACVMLAVMHKTGASGMSFWWTALPMGAATAAIIGIFNGVIVRSIGLSSVILTALIAAVIRWGAYHIGGGEGLLVVPWYEELATEPMCLVLILSALAMGWLSGWTKILPWVLGAAIGLAAGLDHTAQGHAAGYRMLLGAELAGITAMILAGGARSSAGLLLLGAMNVAVAFEGAGSGLHRLGLARHVDAAMVLFVLMAGVVIGLVVKDRKLSFLR